MSASTFAGRAAESPRTRDGSGWQRAAILLILLLAFALRAWTIEAQSLWSDEGITIIRSSLPIAQMLEQMPVEHTPGYFVAMQGWLAVAGTSDYALRGFSMFCGVLGVALLFRLGVDLARPLSLAGALGLVAAFLVAINPFQIAYSQEGRMYAPLFAAASASIWLLWRLLHERSGRRWWFALGYGVTTAATVYLHYYGALVPVTQAIYILIWVIATRRWSAFVTWIVGALVAFALFLPWLSRSLQIFGFEGWRQGGDASVLPLQFARALLSGVAPEGWWQGMLLLSLLLTALGAIWWTVRRSEAGLLVLLMFTIPFGATLWMATRNPDSHERYLIYLGAPLALLVAGGIVGLVPTTWRKGHSLSSRAWLALPFGALLALTVGSSIAQYRLATDPTVQKPDYRGAAQRILAEGMPGDVVIVDGPNPDLVFDHYYSGNLPVLERTELNTAPDDERDATLLADTTTAQRVWELLFFHEPAQVQVWLATQAFASAPTWHNNLRVTLYGLERAGDVTTQFDLPVGEALTLVSATLPPTAQVGDLLRVRTDWYTRARAPEYRFSLRLYDGDGTLVTSDDYVPQNWFTPTNVWAVDAAARDQRALILPADLAPGSYTVALRLYDPASGAPVVTDLGEDLPLGVVEVTP